ACAWCPVSKSAAGFQERVLWAFRAGRSVRNFWRADLFPRRSPSLKAVLRRIEPSGGFPRPRPSHTLGGVLVLANDTPSDHFLPSTKPYCVCAFEPSLSSGDQWATGG